MAFESEQNEQGLNTGDDGAGGPDAAGGGAGDDLSGVLGSPSDAGFVSSEKKPVNTGTLVMAGFILAAAAGTYLMYKRAANAHTAPTPEAAAAQTTITQFLSNDKANAAKMRDLLVNTEKAVEQFRAAPAKKQIPVEDLQTNPFSLDGENEGDDANAQQHLDGATAKRREAERREATLKAAQALNLQFIVSGRKKSCLINNVRYVEGQAVGDFVVESINTNSVIVSKDDARFELKMKKSK
jgi:hypothetical protein